MEWFEDPEEASMHASKHELVTGEAVKVRPVTNPAGITMYGLFEDHTRTVPAAKRYDYVRSSAYDASALADLAYKAADEAKNEGEQECWQHWLQLAQDHEREAM